MHCDFMIEQGEGARFQKREGEGEGEREILGMFSYIIICHGITGMIPCPKTVLEIILEITPRPYMTERETERQRERAYRVAE